MTGPGALVAQQAPRLPLVFIAASTAEITNASTIAYPTGSQEGDLLVLVGFGLGTWTTPTGWTSQFNFTNANGSRMVIYTRIKDASAVINGPSTNSVCLGMLAYRGNGGSVPSVGAVGVGAQSSTSPISATAITPQDVLSTVLGACGDHDVGAGQPGNPTGYTSRVNLVGASNEIRISDKQYASLSSTGTVDFTQDVTSFIASAVLMEIKP